MTFGATVSLALRPPPSGLSPDHWVGGDRRLGEETTTRFWLDLSEAGEAGRGEAWQWAGLRRSVHRSDAGQPMGLVLAFMNCDAAAGEEFDDWYETEHLPRLAGVKGVLTACRYEVLRGSPCHLAVYGLSDLEVSQSSDWMTAARTPWSARMRPFTRDYRRLAFTRG